MTIRKVLAHASVLDLENSIFPYNPSAIVGNYVADALAVRASKDAQLCDDVVERVEALRDKAEVVLRRALAIFQEIARLPREADREIAPVRARRLPLARLKDAIRGTSHSVVPLARRWRCRTCFGTSPAVSPARWFLHQCPGRNGEAQAHLGTRSPHPSHNMTMGTGYMWCITCGAWSAVRFTRSLRVECPGRPAGAFHVYSLSRLRRGLAPLRASAPGGFELEVV